MCSVLVRGIFRLQFHKSDIWAWKRGQVKSRNSALNALRRFRLPSKVDEDSILERKQREYELVLEDLQLLDEEIKRYTDS